MKTISQVAELSGISIRTLQYYDEIGVLKPSEVTSSGYRLYDNDALQKLQQILFFKELGFKLKEINEILQNPDFNMIAAYKKQKELLLLKRNRIDKLIELLSHLERGEQYMSFKEFDLSEYISALETFKNANAEEVMKHWGSLENFDFFVRKIKDDETNLAKLAVKQFGSVEKYTEAMKYNLEHFSEIMDNQFSQIPEEMKKEDLFVKLASCKGEEVASDHVQNMVGEIIAYAHGNAPSVLVGNTENYCRIIIDTYSNDFLKKVFDTKQGSGSCDFIVEAFQCYIANEKLPKTKL